MTQPPQQRTRVIGTEGSYASELVLQAKMRALGWRAGAVALPLIGLVLLPTHVWPLGAAIVLVGLAAAPWLWRRAGGEAAGVSGARVGASAESTVVEVLKGTPGVHAVLSGRNLNSRSREDVDQIAILDSGAVVAIEVKMKRRSVRVDPAYGDLVDSQGEPVKGGPLAQVQRGADGISRALGGTATGTVGRVVCLPESALKSAFEHEGTWVCNASQLPGVLAGLPATVQPDQTRAAVRLIQRRSGVGR